MLTPEKVKEVLKNYGYGKFRNVVSALEFERLECASGPQGGHIKRFSDNETPKKIAFLQCIGSRSDKVEKYCSSICCMYTTKEAIIVKEHQDVECSRQTNSILFPRLLNRRSE